MGMLRCFVSVLLIAQLALSAVAGSTSSVDPKNTCTLASHDSFEALATENGRTLQLNDHSAAIERSLTEDGIYCVDVRLAELEYEGDHHHHNADGHLFICTLENGHKALIEGLNLDDVALSSLFIAGGVLSEDGAKITFSSDDDLVWGDLDSADDSRRRLALAEEIKGEKKVLIISITVNYNGQTWAPYSVNNVAHYVWGIGYGGDDVTFQSQFDACSAGKVDFQPADHGYLNGYEIVNGIVSVTVSVNSDALFTVTNAAYDELGGGFYSSYDNVIYSLPDNSYYQYGSGGWAGLAVTPGQDTYIRGSNIAYPSVLMHEVGHNYGLAHSGSGNEDYGDITGFMGRGHADLNEQKCFNAAKMAQLHWFDDRTTYVKPLTHTIWTGKVISIDGYLDSTEDEHSLIVVLDDPVVENSIYMTYNLAEGINSGTKADKNKLTITVTSPQGRPGKWPVSHVLGALSVGESTTVPEFGGLSQAVEISVDGTGSDGTVKYLTVTIKLEEEVCAADNQCDDGNTCTTNSCGAGGICEFVPIDDCCGNGICELSETCSSCPFDCFDYDDCEEIYGDEKVTTSYKYPGFVFKVEAQTDLYVYEISYFLLEYSDPSFDTITAQVYTKKGDYVGYERTMSAWTEVADDVTAVGEQFAIHYGGGRYGKKYKLFFDQEVFMEAGETRSFYVYAAKTTSYMYILSGPQISNPNTITNENDDIAIYGGKAAYAFYQLGGYYYDFMGEVKYYLPRPETPQPTPQPTPAPTPQPTPGPTKAPTPAPTPQPTPASGDIGNNEGSNQNLGSIGSAFGDPHIKTWSGQLYDFHGACDLVLLQNLDFDDSVGMRIHMRTHFTQQWSYITSAVVQIGDDTLEVVGGQQEEKYYLNKVANADLSAGLSGFAIQYREANSKQREVIIDLGNEEAIQLRTWRDFVRVDFINPTPETFGNCLGLLGRFGEGSKIARDGVTVVEDNNEFGMEWQVLADEPMLFHNADGVVQAPERCAIPDTTKVRRRLRESTVSLEDAELACSRVSGSDEFDACVFDVMATNDKDMAGAY